MKKILALFFGLLLSFVVPRIVSRSVTVNQYYFRLQRRGGLGFGSAPGH